MTTYRRVFVDLDGVLANFDESAYQELGMSPRSFEVSYGAPALWERLASRPNFWARMKPMPQFREVWAWALEHSASAPCVLSAPCRTNRELCVIEKRLWVDSHLGKDVAAIFTADKAKYSAQGNLLIDDRARYRKPWNERGGAFHLYESWAKLRSWEGTEKLHDRI